MTKLLKIQPYGEQLLLLYNDGTRQLAYPMSDGLWTMKPTLGTGGGGDGGTGTPPGGPYSVIYPTATHSVSDSYQDHVDRGSVNPGTDYTAPYGSDVWAVSAGVVTDADDSYGGSGGKTIHIDHDDGNGSDYLHNSVIRCSVGQHVNQGDLIASSGASGYGDLHYYGAHCHISYRTTQGHAYTNFQNIDFDALVKSVVGP
jgi:murein DD-endopeptidase MepM/ murein hydrolase activator NlpD